LYRSLWAGLNPLSEYTILPAIRKEIKQEIPPTSRPSKKKGNSPWTPEKERLKG
jgi:hypothetical protein